MFHSVIDDRKFRAALGNFASGITIIAALVEGEPVGFTCQSFSSVSISPPLVSFCVMNTSTSWPKIRRAHGFSINILSAEQAEISRAFGSKAPDRWSRANWQMGPGGHPILGGTLLSLECRLHQEHEAGDHWLVLATVCDLIEMEATETRPLLFYKGTYRHLADA